MDSLREFYDLLATNQIEKARQTRLYNMVAHCIEHQTVFTYNGEALASGADFFRATEPAIDPQVYKEAIANCYVDLMSETFEKFSF